MKRERRKQAFTFCPSVHKGIEKLSFFPLRLCRPEGRAFYQHWGQGPSLVPLPKRVSRSPPVSLPLLHRATQSGPDPFKLVFLLCAILALNVAAKKFCF